MGITALKALISKHAPAGVSERHLNSYAGKIIVIDTSIYFYRFMSFGNYLSGFTKQILLLLEHNITPIYVFDGKPPDEKKFVLQDRRDKRDKDIAEKLAVEAKIATCKDETELKMLKTALYNISKKIIIVTHEHNDMVKDLLHHFGVPYLVANGEAEILCAKLVKDGHAVACMSEDTDVLPNGCNIFINDFKIVSTSICEYNLDKILEGLKITHEQFVDICILCGCDYTCKIEGLAKEGALTMIRKYKNIEGVINFINYQNKHGKSKYVVPADFNYQRAREIFNTPLDTLVEKHYIKSGMHPTDYTTLAIFIQNNCPDIGDRFPHMFKKVKHKLTLTSSIPSSPPPIKKFAFSSTPAPKLKTIDMYFKSVEPDEDEMQS